MTRVVAGAGDGRAAVEVARAHRPDVAVVDLQMPEPGVANRAEAFRLAHEHGGF